MCHCQLAKVGLEELRPGHPFYHTNPSAEGIAFFTERFGDTPVVLLAPAPSPALRASCLFGDLLRLANALGARPVTAPVR
jgi:aspartokinase/homoserine dehydrogenase 1